MEWMTDAERTAILAFLDQYNQEVKDGIPWPTTSRSTYLEARDMQGAAPVPAGKIARLTIELLDKGSPK